MTRSARWRLMLLLTLCLGIVALATVWRLVRPALLANQQYRVDAQHIHITPPPDWIQADILAEVMRDPSLSGQLSVLDETVSHRLASAFEFHPWVAGVKKVTKRYGPRIDVELVYREPVMMVTLGHGPDALLIPCDVDGVRLPSLEFTAEEKHAYPRLEDIDDEPLVGQPWNDDRVLGAARIARLLSDVWQAWKLDAIRPTISDPSERNALPATEFEIVTDSGVRILWGPPPRPGADSEPPRKERLASLLAKVRRGETSKVIDLRPRPTGKDEAPAIQPAGPGD